MYDEIFFFVIKTIIKEDVKARWPCAGSLRMAWLQGSPLSWRQNGVRSLSWTLGSGTELGKVS